MSKEQYDARVIVNVRRFAPAEDQLLAEASDLGLAVGAIPHFVGVVDDQGREAEFALVKGSEEGWELTLTGYGEPTSGEGPHAESPSQWVPRKMVILND